MQNFYVEEDVYTEYFNPNSNTNQKNFHIKNQNISAMNNTLRYEENSNNNHRFAINKPPKRQKNEQRHVMKNNLSPGKKPNCFKQGNHHDNDAKSVLSNNEINTNNNQAPMGDKKKSKGLRVRAHINSKLNVNNNYHISTNKIKKIQSKRD